MKKIGLFLICTYFVTISFSQPFIKFAATNKGLEAGIGALSGDGGIESTLSFNFPITQVDKPKIVSLTIGKQFLITNYDEDNYSITPTIGYGYLTWKDFSKYDSAVYPGTIPPGGPAGGPLPVADEEIMDMKAFKPAFGLEFAKDSYMGRFGITVNWCRDFYFGINLRIFPYRNLRKQ